MASISKTKDRATCCAKCALPLQSPFSLPCFHAFCSSCAKEMLVKDKTVITCPHCLGRFNNKVFQRNSVMEEVLKQHIQRVAQESKLCKDSFPRCEHLNVTWKCFNCYLCFCESCKSAHEKICKGNISSLLPLKKVSEYEALSSHGRSNHTYVELLSSKYEDEEGYTSPIQTGQSERDEVLPGAKPKLPPRPAKHQPLPKAEVSMTCKYHEDEEIKLQCSKCKVAICLKCKIEKHDTHPSESIEKAFEDILPVFLKSLVDTKQFKAEKQIQADKMSAASQSTKDYYETVKRKILAEKQMQIEYISAATNTLLEEVEKIQHQSTSELDDKAHDCNQTCQSLEQLETWGEAMVTYVKGPAVLYQLQHDFISEVNAKMGNIYEYISNPSPLLKFCPKQLPRDLIGHLEEKGPYQSYRQINRELKMLKKDDCVFVKKWPLKHTSIRFCLHNHEIWIPCFSSCLIEVYSLDGDFIKDVKVELPKVVHPINNMELFVASENGLFLMLSSGTIVAKVSDEEFSDISVNKSNLALRQKGKIYIIKNFAKKLAESKPLNLKTSFEVDHYEDKRIILGKDILHIGNKQYSFDGSLHLDGENARGDTIVGTGTDGAILGINHLYSKPDFSLTPTEMCLYVDTQAIVSKQNVIQGYNSACFMWDDALVSEDGYVYILQNDIDWSYGSFDGGENTTIFMYKLKA